MLIVQFNNIIIQLQFLTTQELHFMPEVIINGPEGRIEARYTPSNKPESPIALILHPEPNQGGTMNNKVIFGLYREFVKRDFSTLRFNFIDSLSLFKDEK